MDPRPTQPLDQTDDDLVAYLDGELGGESSRAIEHRLSEDGDFRRRLRDLEQAWHLLDELPRATVDDTFTQTTVEMVAVAAEADVGAARRVQTAARRRGILLGGVGLVAASALGFLLANVAVPRLVPTATPKNVIENEQLLQDLAILENLDPYLQIDDVAFLERLADDGLLGKEASDDP